MINERKLSENELDARFAAVKGLLKNKVKLVKKYGKDAEKVMYGIATKQAKKKVENMNLDKLSQMIEDALKNPKKADLNKDGKLSDYEEKRGAAIEKATQNELFGDDIFDKDEEETFLGVKVKEEEGEGNERAIKGQELVDYIMSNWNWSEEKTLNWLANNFGKNKQDDGPKEEDQRYIDYLRRSGRDKEADKLVALNPDKIKENRFLAASMEDLEQVIRNLAHTGEMSEDEAIEMAIRKLENMLDGRDDMDENIKEYVNIDKVAGGIPYTQSGPNAVVKGPLDDATKERLIKKCKEKGLVCKPNNGGGVTIFKVFMEQEGKEELKEWGSSDQSIFLDAMHKDAGKPEKMPSPFDSKLRAAAEDAVDFYWEDWPEYKLDREGLVDKAVRSYLRRYFKKDFEMMQRMFEPTESLKIEESPSASDNVASDIQKALNKHGKDDSKKHQILRARKALNKGDMATAKKIVARYLEEKKIDEIDSTISELEEVDNSDYAMKIRAMRNKKPTPKPSNVNPNFKPNVKPNAKLDALKKRRAQIMRDMEQEAEPEGGPIADKYGDMLNKIDVAIAKASGRKEMDYDTAVGKLSESDVELSKDPIERLKTTMYVDDDNPRQILVHPLSKPDARRPDKSYIVIKGNNVVAIQGYDSGPIEDLAQAYGLDASRSSLTPIGQRSATGQASMLSSNILKDAIKAIEDSRDLEAKRQKDYYQSRGPVSGVGNMDESDVELSKDQMDKLHNDGSVKVDGHKIIYKITQEVLAKLNDKK